MKKRVLAFDLGASSGRAIMGHYDNGKLCLEELSRFAYDPIIIDNKMHWDIELIVTEITKAIAKVSKNYQLDSLAIDTWGVDYGLLDEHDELIEPPVHYRDPRTNGMLATVAKLIPEDSLYQMTGNQLMEINTLFQLMATIEQEPEKLAKAKTLLLMPDLLNFLLTGKQKTQLSIASTTQLLDPVKKCWHHQLIEKLKIPKHLFTELTVEGQLLAELKPELNLPPIPVYHVCAHDTASAFVSGVSSKDSLFISCGTWSLIGVERSQPVINKLANRYNLTNESGAFGTTRLLKNITGLWIIQELKREFASLGRVYTYPDLETMARAAKPFGYLIDTEDPSFLLSGKMIGRIEDFLKKTKQPLPQTDGEIVRGVYESLAFKYKAVIFEIMDTVGQKFSQINMVGGGILSKLLCEMVANASGLTVHTGPVEATALGNIAIQLYAHGCFASLQETRSWIRNLSDIKMFTPDDAPMWDAEFERYRGFTQSSTK